MCETFGQDPRRSIFERFHLFMNCCNVFFHVILDWKLNVSEFAESLATRIVWCCAYVWDFWARSLTFNFWVSFLDFASRNSKRRLKIESLRCCSNFGYQNSLMLCWCGTLLAKIRGVQFLKGFISSWTAATCSFMLFLIENWMSPNLLKVWLPE